jgi:hypothetical protein
VNRARPARRASRGVAGPAVAALAAVAALLHLAACGDADRPAHGTGPAGDAASPAPVVRDSAGIEIRAYPAEILAHPARRQLAPEPRVVIGVVEGPAAYQWTRPVAAVRLAGGGFVVAEQSPGELRFFDALGTHLRTVGSAGQGPGEFRQLAGLARLPGDTLLAWDAGSLRLTWFTPEGERVRDLTLEPQGGLQGIRHVTVDAEGGLLVLGPTSGWEELENRGRVRESWRILPLDPGGGVGRPLGTVPGTEREVRVNRTGPGNEGIVSIEVRGRWWWGEGFVRGSDRGAWTADRLRLEVRHFGGEASGSGEGESGAPDRPGRPDRPDRIVRVQAPDRPFTRALIDSLHAAELEGVTDPEFRRLWVLDMETREYPETVPPVESLFADQAGRVWIGLTPLPRRILPSGGRTAVDRWLVTEPAEARGILTLPPMSHPLWADQEGLLLLRNDHELGVAYVEWYRFEG